MADYTDTSSDSTFGKFLPFLMQALGTGAGAATGGFGAAALGTLGLGAVQAIGGLIGLSKLKRQARPQYEISPELQKAYGLAEERSKMGFTPTQTAEFQQQMARSQQADYLNAIRMGGGGLAQAISGGLGGQRLQALNRFAAQDAAQQAANIGQFYGMAGQMQAQRNRIKQQEIAYRMAQEQAMGGALSSGLTNVASGINAWGLGGFKSPFGKKAGGDETTTTTTAPNYTYEQPSWAYQPKSTTPSMPSGWNAPMAPGYNPYISYPPIGGGFNQQSQFNNYLMPQ